jgi:hypothetical protein
MLLKVDALWDIKLTNSCHENLKTSRLRRLRSRAIF